MEDITASDVRDGRDIQGIPWGTLNVTREEYRDKRIPYHDYQDKDRSVASAARECKSRTIKVENCYMFRRFSRSVQSSCFHFQPTTRAIKSHFDYGSASAWHPDGNYFATGNQDKTCRIWDRRMVPKCLDVLKGNLGAIRSIRFTSDGQYMAMGESADFIHLYDVHCEGGYRKEQEIDFFGELSGMCFSPGAESLFVSVSHPQYGGLLEFRNKLFRRYRQVG